MWLVELASDGTVVDQSLLTSAANGFGGSLDTFDALGASLAVIGDLDGDEVVDVAVGSPGDGDGGFFSGAVWILFLNADGTIKDEQKISETEGGLGVDLDFLGFFGASLAFLGDADDDGKPELAVGAPGQGFLVGKVCVLELNSDGTVSSATPITDGAGGFGGSLEVFDQFGASVAAIGDLDGDGIGELAVGAAGDGDGGGGRGAVWILFLDADGTVLSETKISSTSGSLVGPLDDEAQFGRSLAALGDQDADGIPDLLVGASDNGFSNDGPGSIWIFFLAADGTVRQEQRVTQDIEGFEGPIVSRDRFGSSAVQIGDLNGDGVGEFLIGAIGDDDGGDGAGAVWVLFPTAPTVEDFNGSDVNPSVLEPDFDPPSINSFWEPFITLPAVGGGSDPLVFFYGVSNRRSELFDVSLGPLGELLISLAPGDLSFLQAVPPGQAFQQFIPDDINLVGLECFSQGAILGTLGDITLTNGIDFVIGF